MATIFWIGIIIWFVVLPIYRALTKGKADAAQPNSGALTREEMSNAAQRLDITPQDILSGNAIERIRAEALRYRKEQLAEEEAAEQTKAQLPQYERVEAVEPLDSASNYIRYQSVEQDTNPVLEGRRYQPLEHSILDREEGLEVTTAEEEALLAKYKKYMVPPTAEGGETVFKKNTFEQEEANFGKVEPRKVNQKVEDLRKMVREPASFRQVFLLKEIFDTKY